MEGILPASKQAGEASYVASHLTTLGKLRVKYGADYSAPVEERQRKASIAQVSPVVRSADMQC